MVTGTTARSPLSAVSFSRAWHRAGLLATATSAEAGKLIVFVPHSGPLGRWRSGLDARISNPPEPERDTTARSRGGTLTVSVRRNDCGPFTKTTRRVRPPRHRYPDLPTVRRSSPQVPLPVLHHHQMA